MTDHLGSTIALASSTGSIERRYDYTIDGEDTPSGSGPSTWIKYAGGHDIGNGLYHFGERYYQPSTARWMQKDPLDQPDDLVQQNAYNYAANNPINFTDPTGEIVFVPVIAVGAGAGLKALGITAGAAAAGAGAGYLWAHRKPKSRRNTPSTAPKNNGGRGSEHTSGARGSTNNVHQKGKARTTKSRSQDLKGRGTAGGSKRKNR